MASDIAIDPPLAVAPAAASRPWRHALLAVGLLALTLGVWGVIKQYLYARRHVMTDNAQIDGHVTVIAPRISGFIERVLVEENQQVHAGDTLVLLDPRDLAVRLQQAEADLENAKAAVGTERHAGQAAAQLQATRAEAASAQAAVAATEANERKAAADLERYRGLAIKRIVSAQQLDAAQASFDGAQANLEAARRHAAAAGSQVTAATAALRGAGARLASAAAAVEDARLQWTYATITAPADGMVARRSAEPGAQVQVGQHLMSLVPDRELWITANLKETQLAGVRVGDPVEFTVDAYPGRSFHGSVESLSPATGARFALLPPDNATGNFTKVVQRVPVRIAVVQDADAAAPLRPGMSAEVTITTN